MNKYTENVKRGAALLDQEQPGWREKIDLATLDFSVSVGILEQLFEEYECALDTLLGIDLSTFDDVGEWLDSLDYQTVVDHGFTIDYLKVEDDATAWQALRSAWIAELNESASQQKEQLPEQLEPDQESRI